MGRNTCNVGTIQVQSLWTVSLPIFKRFIDDANDIFGTKEIGFFDILSTRFGILRSVSRTWNEYYYYYKLYYYIYITYFIIVYYILCIILL